MESLQLSKLYLLLWLLEEMDRDLKRLDLKDQAMEAPFYTHNLDGLLSLTPLTKLKKQLLLKMLGKT